MSALITSYLLVHPAAQRRYDGKELIVFLHGLHGNMSTWKEVIQPIATKTGRSVLCYDQPSHGLNPDFADSVEAEANLKPRVLAAALLELLRALHIPDTTKLHLHGQSFGGKTALCFSERYPSRVLTLGLGDIGVKACERTTLDEARVQYLQFRRLHREVWPNLDSARRYLNEVTGKGGDRYSRKLLLVDGQNAPFEGPDPLGFATRSISDLSDGTSMRTAHRTAKITATDADSSSKSATAKTAATATVGSAAAALSVDGDGAASSAVGTAESREDDAAVAAEPFVAPLLPATYSYVPGLFVPHSDPEVQGADAGNDDLVAPLVPAEPRLPADLSAVDSTTQSENAHASVETKSVGVSSDAATAASAVSVTHPAMAIPGGNHVSGATSAEQLVEAKKTLAQLRAAAVTGLGIRVLVRPYNSFMLQYWARHFDYRDAWLDFEGATIAFRASDTQSCVGDDEWALMKELRREGPGAERRNRFVRIDGAHGVHRSHPVVFVDAYVDFINHHDE